MYTDYLASRGYRRVTVWRSTIDGVAAKPVDIAQVPEPQKVVAMRRAVK